MPPPNAAVDGAISLIAASARWQEVEAMKGWSVGVSARRAPVGAMTAVGVPAEARNTRFSAARARRMGRGISVFATGAISNSVP